MQRSIRKSIPIIICKNKYIFLKLSKNAFIENNFRLKVLFAEQSFEDFCRLLSLKV